MDELTEGEGGFQTPTLLLEMDELTDEVPAKMSVEKQDIPKVAVVVDAGEEAKFRWEMSLYRVRTQCRPMNLFCLS